MSYVSIHIALLGHAVQDIAGLLVGKSILLRPFLCTRLIYIDTGHVSLRIV